MRKKLVPLSIFSAYALITILKNVFWDNIKPIDRFALSVIALVLLLTAILVASIRRDDG